MDRQTRKLLNALAHEHGASYTLRMSTSGHMRVTLTLGGISRFIIASGSTPCRHGPKNFLADIRRTLARMKEQIDA